MTQHDTIVVTQPDSATFYAWVQCDSLGNVLLQQLNEERGRHIDILTDLVTCGSSARIQVKSVATPQTFVVPLSDKTLLHTRTSSLNQNNSHSRTAPTPPLKRLRERLLALAAAIVAFALGFLAGRLQRPA